jgi:WD40 repeat protein
MKIWEVQEKTEIIGHEARLLSIHFSGDGKYIATGSRDKTIKVRFEIGFNTVF